MGIDALPFSRKLFWSPLPKPKQYPKSLQHIGDHIRRRRLDLGLWQIDVAVILGTTEDSITGWENGRSKPQLHYVPRIVEFLGYFPYDYKPETFEARLYFFRLQNGLSAQKLGSLLGVDGSTVISWERRKQKPSGYIFELLQLLF